MLNTHIMKNKILWINPSRNRPEKLERFLNSWKECSTEKSDMLIGVDSDDNSYNELMKKFPEVIWEIGEPAKGAFLKVVNEIAVKYSNEYSYIGFIEDDALIETKGYEDQFISKLETLGSNGIVYANDGINSKRKLIYFPVMDSSIIRRLGFMVAPTLRCMYADDYWRDLAHSIGTFHKFEDIFIKHLHYTVEKDKPIDEISMSVDSNRPVDEEAYRQYFSVNLPEDIKKLC